MQHINDFDTGDILLFSGNGVFPSGFIELMTDSAISHIGIVVRNPLINGTCANGLYVFESTAFIDTMNVENNQYTAGVQINSLDAVIAVTNGAIYWRRLVTTRDTTFTDTMNDVYRLTYGATYDFNPEDWVKAYFDIVAGNETKTTEFICSALATFVYQKLGLLYDPVQWSIIRPVDWATAGTDTSRLRLKDCSLDPPVLLKANPEPPGILARIYAWFQ
jgi:hypothetical protein